MNDYFLELNGKIFSFLTLLSFLLSYLHSSLLPHVPLILRPVGSTFIRSLEICFLANLMVNTLGKLQILASSESPHWLCRVSDFPSTLRRVEVSQLAIGENTVDRGKR